MCEMLSEKRLTLNQLAHREKVNPSTVWRWAQRGVRGCVLETFSIGGRRFTTEEAFERFVAETTAVAKGQVKPLPKSRTPRQRRLAIERAERELDEAGI